MKTKHRITDSYIKRLAATLTRDLALRDDLFQEARVELLGLPEDKPEGYYRRALRYHLLNYLRSYNTGNWWVGRDNKDSRYLRLDDLTRSGVQLDTEGRIYGQGAVYAHFHFNRLREFENFETA